MLRKKDNAGRTKPHLVQVTLRLLLSLLFLVPTVVTCLRHRLGCTVTFGPTIVLVLIGAVVLSPPFHALTVDMCSGHSPFSTVISALITVSVLIGAVVHPPSAQTTRQNLLILFSLLFVLIAQHVNKFCF